MATSKDDKLMWEAYQHKKIKASSIVDEGIWDRLKARGAGVKGTVKGAGQRIAGATKGAVAGVKGDISGVQSAQAQQLAGKAVGLNAKTLSLANSHIQKISKDILDFQNDMTKLGLDPDTIQQTYPAAGTALITLDRALKTLQANFQKGLVQQKVSAVGKPVKPAQPITNSPVNN